MSVLKQNDERLGASQLSERGNTNTAAAHWGRARAAGGEGGAATASGGMAATAHPEATEAAVEMLRENGNAVDAAVAAAWALSVCEPSGSGLGGKTTLLIRFANGQTKVIDGRSPAPAGVTQERVNRTQQKTGYRACTVPSTAAALGWAQQQYGRLRFSRVLEPAIRLAEDGFRLSHLYCRHLGWCQEALHATAAARALFLKEGELYQPGEKFRQAALGRTLRRLALAGPDDFYLGQIAGEIVRDMVAHDGLMTAADLAESARPKECEALMGSYRGYLLWSAPPPAGGLQLLLGLKILEHFPADRLCSAPAEDTYAALALVIQSVFRERENCDFPPDQMTSSLARCLLSSERTAALYHRLNGGTAEAPAPGPEASEEDGEGETTHLCTADRQGNVVSLTQSIQSLFGAKVANESLGFLYNDCLSTCLRRPHPYQLAGRALARSNMAPTIMLPPMETLPPSNATAKARPFWALGSAGSRRIISSLLHVIRNVIDGRLGLAEAVSRARVHVTVLGRAHVEEPAATPTLRKFLEQRFKSVRIHRRLSFYMGGVQAIQGDQAGQFMGAADPRRDGNAAGVEEGA